MVVQSGEMDIQSGFISIGLKKIKIRFYNRIWRITLMTDNEKYISQLLYLRKILDERIDGEISMVLTRKKTNPEELIDSLEYIVNDQSHFLDNFKN